MTSVATREAIEAAELRLDQSRRNFRQSMESTRATLRAAIARPSTLVVVALVSGVSAFFLTRRRHPSVTSVPNNAESPSKKSGGGLLRWFVSMYGARVLSFALQRGTDAAAVAQSSGSANANTPGTSPSGTSAAP
jgi:hypothetical protein